jgi:hypothetical protein
MGVSLPRQSSGLRWGLEAEIQTDPLSRPPRRILPQSLPTYRHPLPTLQDMTMTQPAALRFYVPEPAVRPGGARDFSNARIPEAGSVRRPEIDADPESIRDLAFSIIRVLDRNGDAVGLSALISCNAPVTPVPVNSATANRHAARHRPLPLTRRARVGHASFHREAEPKHVSILRRQTPKVAEMSGLRMRRQRRRTSPAGNLPPDTTRFRRRGRSESEPCALLVHLARKPCDPLRL